MILALLAASQAVAQVPYQAGERDYNSRVYVALSLRDGLDPKEFEHSVSGLDHGKWTFEHPVGSIPNTYVFSAPKEYTPIENIRDQDRLEIEGGVLAKRELRKRQKLIKKHGLSEEEVEKRLVALERLDYDWSERGLGSLEVLSERRIQKRAPVDWTAEEMAYLERVKREAEEAKKEGDKKEDQKEGQKDDKKEDDKKEDQKQDGKEDDKDDKEDEEEEEEDDDDDDDEDDSPAMPVQWKPVDESMYGGMPADDPLYDVYRKFYPDEVGIKDPSLWKQWYLHNVHKAGHDLNVTGLWLRNVTGWGIVTAVVDDGLDMNAEDIKANYYAEGSWDFNFNKSDPKPSSHDDYHGTRCAGEIAAVRNEVCGVGVAYDSKVAGIRILSKEIAEDIEAMAINYAMDKNDIYSCSWGPPDNGQTMARPGKVVKDAMVNAITNGRQGKGNVFVFASGNGGSRGDNCNFDGYTNSIYSITVGALDFNDGHPYYSEACSANMVVTYSSGSEHYIVGTDINAIDDKTGAPRCQNQHGGTSAAAPLAAGVFALALSVRPELTWRDMQYLALYSAVEINSKDEGWQKTASGQRFHHQFGYGKLDASKIVELAEGWELVNNQTSFHSDVKTVSQKVKYNEPLKSVITVTRDELDKVNFKRAEHITAVLNLEASYRGHVRVLLKGPRGVVSELAALRRDDRSKDGYDNWAFMSVAHWADEGEGEWELTVENTGEQDQVELVNWQLNVFGEQKDKKEEEKPEDKPEEKPEDEKKPEEGDKEGEKEGEQKEGDKEGDQKEGEDKPEDEKKPEDKPEEKPEDEKKPEDKPTDDSKESQPSGEESHTSWWPDLSSKKVAWLYGAVLLVGGFIAVIGIYACVTRRNRVRRNRSKDTPSASAFEFDLIPHDDSDDDFVYPEDTHRRSGDNDRLYDPFAEVEDDDDMFRISDEGEDAHDVAPELSRVSMEADKREGQDQNLLG